MFEHSQPNPSRNVEPNRWRHRIGCTANLFFDIETDSSDTDDEELERLAIEALKRASSGPSDLPFYDIGIDIPALLNGRLYPEPDLEDGLEDFSIKDCSQLKAEG